MSYWRITIRIQEEKMGEVKKLNGQMTPFKLKQAISFKKSKPVNKFVFYVIFCWAFRNPRRQRQKILCLWMWEDCWAAQKIRPAIVPEVRQNKKVFLDLLKDSEGYGGVFILWKDWDLICARAPHSGWLCGDVTGS